MNINLTLLIQAINFIIAYFIITKIVLKPAIEVFAKETEIDQKLHQSIEIAKEKVNKKEAFKQERWQVCQRYFKQHQPESEFKITETKIGKIELKRFKIPNSQTLENLAKDISTKIKDKLIH